MSRWYEHKIPPPVIDLAVGVLMWVLARNVPSAQLWQSEPLSVATLAGLSRSRVPALSLFSTSKQCLLSNERTFSYTTASDGALPCCRFRRPTYVVQTLGR